MFSTAISGPINLVQGKIARTRTRQFVRLITAARAGANLYARR